MNCWTIGDLSVFRLWHHRQVVARNGLLPGELNRNRDGSSNFMAYKINDLYPYGFVVAGKPPDNPNIYCRDAIR